VSTFDDCLRLIKSDPRMLQFAARGKNDCGALYFACSHVTRDNKCSIYKKRPRLCKEYPDTGMIRYGAIPKDDCGFWFVNRFTDKKVS